MEKFEKNKIVFLIYILLTGKMFVGTTQVLFLTYKGFSFTEIMLISTIVGIGSLILEVPSGMVADRIGYRKCNFNWTVIKRIRVCGYFILKSFCSYCDLFNFNFSRNSNSFRCRLFFAI